MSVCSKVRGQLTGVSSLPLSCGSQGSNSGPPAWQQLLLFVCSFFVCLFNSLGHLTGLNIILSLGKNPESWAKGLKHEDFELLCLDGTRKPVTEAQSCHLARVPNHAVFSRKDKAGFVRRILFNQQVWVPMPTPCDPVPGSQSCTDAQVPMHPA